MLFAKRLEGQIYLATSYRRNRLYASCALVDAFGRYQLASFAMDLGAWDRSVSNECNSLVFMWVLWTISFHLHGILQP